MIDSATDTPEDKHRKGIERAFDPWNGSHINLVQFVKANLKDPGSFEHIETRYGEMDDGNIKVYMRYRARNSFGGMVPSEIIVTAKPDGELIEVLESTQ